VEYDQVRSRSKLVVNGSAFDRSTVVIGNATSLEIPSSAQVVFTDADKSVRIYQRKVLVFMGRPERRMSPCTARRALGCAYQRLASTLRLSTYGEWSNIEGSAFVELVVEVPIGIAITSSPTLSGPQSEGAHDEALFWLKHRQADPDWWYAADQPSHDWTALDAEPDGCAIARNRVRTSGVSGSCDVEKAGD
jgi:hypothetical protein